MSEPPRRAPAEEADLLRQLAEHISEVAWLTDPSKNAMLYVSPGYEKVWGRSCRSLYESPKTWLDSIHPEDRERVLKAAVEKQAAGTYDEVYRILRPDGEVRWIRDRAFPIRGASGDVERIAGIASDITALKRTEKDLRRSVIEQQVLFDHIPAMVWYKDKDNRILRLNEAAAATAGLPVSRIEGRSTYELYPKEAAKYHKDDLEVIESGKPKLGIIETLQVGGETRWVRTDKVPYRDEDDNIVGVLVFAQDVTERMRAERDLKESRNRLQEIFESAPIGMTLIGLDGSILKANHALARMLEYEEAELLKLTLGAITHPEDRDSLAQAEKLLRGETAFYETQKRYVTAGGSTLWVHLTASLIRDQDGLPLYALGMIQDVTAQRKLEAQVVQSEKMSAVGKLAGGVAHEFNNTLTGIMGLAHFVQKSVGQGHPAWQDAEQILLASRKSADLIARLLTFSRRQPARRGSLNLNHLIERMERILKPMLGERIELSLAYDPELMTVSADPNQIEQVVMNLCINARDAMGGPGRLRVESKSVGIHAETPLSHGRLAPGWYAMLRVQDSGPGLSPEAQKHLFEPFFTTKKVNEGTGLGLSIVYGIIEQHEGAIDVVNEPGRGLDFRVYLPAAAAKAPAEEEPRPAQAPVRGSEAILVAEDDATARRVLVRVLKAHGYEVVEAEDGVQAVAAAAANKGRLALALFDIVMPRLQGTDAYLEIAPSQPELRFLFMSGYATSQAHSLIHERGLPFIAKPFSPEAVCRKVREVLDARKAP